MVASVYALNLTLTCIYFLMQESLEKIAPTWMNVSLTMKNDPETDKAFGWVLEMFVVETESLFINWLLAFSTTSLFSDKFLLLLIRYGYAIASALHGVRHILRKDFMLQVGMGHVLVTVNGIIFHVEAILVSLFCQSYIYINSFLYS